jgi:hypothetical protein
MSSLANMSRTDAAVASRLGRPWCENFGLGTIVVAPQDRAQKHGWAPFP